MLRGLRGDFFCAPFGECDLTPAETRPHGATANRRWALRSCLANALEFELDLLRKSVVFSHNSVHARILNASRASASHETQ